MHDADAEVERITAIVGQTWTEILGSSSVKADDTFLHLGGDSIAAAMCATRLSAQFGCDVPVEAMLHEGRTAREMAVLIRTMCSASRHSEGIAP